MPHDGLQAALDANREQLLRYLRAHGAGAAAEDLLQDLWLKAAAGATGPIASPLNYLYPTATNLMIHQRRSETQRQQREQEWSSLTDRIAGVPANDPGPERSIDGQERLALVERELGTLQPRALAIFREHRLGGRTQREIASSMRLSASTIESDLRMVYRLLDDLRRRLDEEQPQRLRPEEHEAQ